MSRKSNKFLDNFEPTLTKQSFKADCDINNIVAKYRCTGLCNHINSDKPRWIDCVGVADYQVACELIDSACAQFAALPAKIRARFDNNPEKMLAFCEDSKNFEEAVKLGIVAPPEGAQKLPEKAPEPTSESPVAST